MASVEAAASLFGSEDPGSDLFATLGAEPASLQPPSDDFFSYASQTEVNDFSSRVDGSSLREPSSTDDYHTHSRESLTENIAEDFTSFGNSENGWNGQGQWNTHEYAGSGEAFLVSTPQSVEVPANATYPDDVNLQASHGAYNGLAQPSIPATSYPNYTSNAYDPLSRTASYSTYGAHDPPAAAAASPRPIYDSYAPPASVPTMTGPTYGSYESPATTQSIPQVPHRAYDPPASVSYHKPEPSGKGLPGLPYAPLSALSPPSMPPSQYNGMKSVSTPPVSAKTTITRPKVSNAYDPPFPAILPTRRGSRPALSQQLQAQYQNPATPYYAPPVEALSAHANASYLPQISHEEAIHSSEDTASNGHYTGETTHPNSGGQNDIYTQASLSYDGFSDHSARNFAKESQVFHAKNAPGQILWEDNVSRGDGVYKENFPDSSEFHISNGIPSPLPANVLLDASQVKSANMSPSSIPLPQSPPLEDIQHVEGGDSSHTDFSAKSSPYQNHASQQGHKKDIIASKTVYDPYAPKINHTTNNYIPRTSSPLSLHNLRSSETSKLTVSASFNSGNAAPPGNASIPRPLIGTLRSGSLHEDHTPRQMAGWSETKLGPQDITIKATAGQYAPSPSLLGANDPLSRTSARAPVITFGFGGKMITCFHGMPGLNAGFDVAFSSRTSSELKIHMLHKILPESTLNTSFPGPLLSDPGTTSISLVRQNAATQTKTKKTAVMAYLSGRISEIHQGLGYMSSLEKQTAENKLILVKLLNIMIENDGRLLGTPQSEAAVRSTLVPRLDGAPVLQDAVSLQASYKSPSLHETPISVTTLRPYSLDKIEEFLLQGDRRQAYQFAMNEKLWAHAMVIASSIDKDAWKEVVHDFLRAELVADGASDSKSNSSQTSSQQNARESLRVAYSLFSGSGSAAIQELIPQNLMHRGFGGRLQQPMLPVTTPRTPNFMSMQPNPVPTIPSDALAKWAETAAMMISSPLSLESSAALTALGDQLLANNLPEAAHSCYLLSLQTSMVGGLGSPTARITLVGSKNPANATKDPDALIFSEVLEFALSLVPTVKGQEPFHGISHLQAYRFIRAVELAEHGDLQLANRYCDAITACLGHTSSYTNITLLEQLQGLQQRISGVFHGEKSGSWIGGKISKPSLDSIGGWLEGRFTKLVTGDSENEAAIANNSKISDQPFVGPFAHYSTISSTTPSARSSPQPQSAGLNMVPQRTSSAMDTATPYSQQYQVERSSSAMGYLRQRPAVQTNASGSNSLASSQSSPIGFGLNSRDNAYSTPSSQIAQMDEELETPVQGSSWWQENDNNGSNNTPTNATFMKIEGSSLATSSDGFISLMDDHSFAVGPSKHQQSSSVRQEYDEDEDADLGIGNSKPKSVQDESNAAAEDASKESPKAAPPVAEKKDHLETPAAAGGSWLGRWWKRSDSTTPAPIKASLGEESAFYYDKEQKRWVNRKAGADEAPKPATPPPPPSRTHTASPGMSGTKPAAHTGPPLRPSSTASEPPMKASMRIRSNLAPPTESAPSTPTGTRMNPTGPPPPSRPRSQAAKRNIRSRYVDVLQQEGGSA